MALSRRTLELLNQSVSALGQPLELGDLPPAEVTSQGDGGRNTAAVVTPEVTPRTPTTPAAVLPGAALPMPRALPGDASQTRTRRVNAAGIPLPRAIALLPITDTPPVTVDDGTGGQVVVDTGDETRVRLTRVTVPPEAPNPDDAAPDLPAKRTLRERIAAIPGRGGLARTLAVATVGIVSLVCTPIFMAGGLLVVAIWARGTARQDLRDALTATRAVATDLRASYLKGAASLTRALDDALEARDRARQQVTQALASSHALQAAQPTAQSVDVASLEPRTSPLRLAEATAPEVAEPETLTAPHPPEQQATSGSRRRRRAAAPETPEIHEAHETQPETQQAQSPASDVLTLRKVQTDTPGLVRVITEGVPETHPHYMRTHLSLRVQRAKEASIQRRQNRPGAGRLPSARRITRPDASQAIVAKVDEGGYFTVVDSRTEFRRASPGQDLG